MDPEQDALRHLTVRYRLPPELLIEAQRLSTGVLSPRSTFMLAFLCLSYGAGVGSLIGQITRGSQSRAIAIGVAFGVIVFSGLRRARMRSLLQQARSADLFRDQSLTIRPEGFEHAYTDGRRSFYPWTRRMKVFKTATLFVIRFQLFEDTVLIVPLEAFGSNSSPDHFLQTARRWHEQAVDPDEGHWH